MVLIAGAASTCENDKQHQIRHCLSVVLEQQHEHCLSSDGAAGHVPDITLAHSGLNLKRDMARVLRQLSMRSAAALGLRMRKPAVANRCTSVEMC